MARIASGGEPPSETRDGEEYAPPWRGVFLTENRGRLEHFLEENVLALPYLMMQYASSIGDPVAAARWRTRVAATSAARDLPLLRAGIYRDQVAQLLLDGEVVRAIAQAARIRPDHGRPCGRASLGPASAVRRPGGRRDRKRTLW